jgi:hypothetical protein
MKPPIEQEREHLAMNELREKVARAMKYIVMVKPGEYQRDDTYHIMEGPDCIVQVGGDFADDHAANEECGRLNIDAAISAVMQDLEAPSEGLSETVSLAAFKEWCGADADPFEKPISYDYAGKIAAAVVKSIAAQYRKEAP